MNVIRLKKKKVCYDGKTGAIFCKIAFLFSIPLWRSKYLWRDIKKIKNNKKN